jgi:hypothetical protein
MNLSQECTGEHMTEVVAIAYPIDGGIVSLLLSPIRIPAGLTYKNM